MSEQDYLVHKIPKISGGKVVGLRVIEEPKPELKQSQKQLVKRLQQEIDFPNYINGVARTSIISNSIPHINKSIIYKIDLKDFFHTVGIDKIARSLSNPLLDIVEQNCMFNNRLPTGAPTSPILANIAFLSTDIKINKLLSDHIAYTRYMDDLCMSAYRLEYITPDLINTIIKLIESDGYIINRKKSGLHLDFKRQEVTGIVVNRKLNLSKDKRLLMRAKLDHHARETNKLTEELAGELAHISNISKDLYNKYINYYNKRVNFYGNSI